MSGDVHTPTNAGPGPTPAIPGDMPAGAARPDFASALEDEHPEILVGAAFLGGVVAAFILKRFGNDDD